MTPEKINELISKYENGYSLFLQSLNKFPQEALRWKPSEMEWSAAEVVLHCADSETNAAMRIRYLAAEDNPLIVGYDQDVWAAVFNYQNLPIEPAMELLKAVRASTSTLIKRFNEMDWKKVGKHSEYGVYAAEKWLELYSVHLTVHTDQLNRILTQWEEKENIS